MDIKSLRAEFLKRLLPIYEKDEVLSFFYMLSEKIIGLNRVNVAINLNKKLSQEEQISFDKAVVRLVSQEPIQYIIGESCFFGLTFLVNGDVLIPRPETEELVDWILKDQLDKSESISILDIGTGSGCIAISLAKNLPKAKVYAVDISESALSMAKKNAVRNDVDITFVHADILETQELFQYFDVIVSNPPYVRDLEKKEIKSNVLDNEPHKALFVSDKNPLVFYEKIVNLAGKKLKSNGLLYFEINQYLGIETKKMIEDHGFDSVYMRKDINGNDRMICAQVNKVL